MSADDMTPRLPKQIELRRPRHLDEGYDHELLFTSPAGSGTSVERLTDEDLAELRRVVGPRPSAILRDGDQLVGRLSPDADLVIDASRCIVVRTPERRITVSSADDWANRIQQARMMIAVMDDEDTRR